MADEIKERTVYMLCREDKDEDNGKDVYVGSTSKTVKERLRCHIKDAQIQRNVNNRLYKRMKEVGLQNWKMVPLLTFACDKKTIFEYEKQCHGLIGADLNMRSPITDRKKYKAEYHQNNRDAILKQRVGYRIANRGMLLKKGKEYRENNVRTKKYYCDVCDIPFGYKKDLDKHLSSLKHSYAYMNSVD